MTRRTLSLTGLTKGAGYYVRVRAVNVLGVGPTGSCSVTLTANTTVGAEFSINSYTLTVTGPTHGTVSSSPSGISACTSGSGDCDDLFQYAKIGRAHV